MKNFLREFWYNLTGHYASSVMEPKAYQTIEYLRQIGYTPKIKKGKRKK